MSPNWKPKSTQESHNVAFKYYLPNYGYKQPVMKKAVLCDLLTLLAYNKC